jgi:hypothetical protein
MQGCPGKAPETLQHTLPFLLPALLLWVVYRRIRRNFGLQRWRPARIAIRIVQLSLIAAMLAASALALPHVAPALLAGAGVGGALAYFGTRHTHVEWKNGGRFYTPHPWIGALLTALLLGRLAWRYLHVGMIVATAGGAPVQSPLTFGIAAVLIVYSLAYGIGLVLRMRALGPAPPASAGITPSIG